MKSKERFRRVWLTTAAAVLAIGAGVLAAGCGDGDMRATRSGAVTSTGTGERRSAASTETESAGPPPQGRIAFTCGDPPQICLVNADGSGKRQLTKGAFYSTPSWSTDGTLVAFTGSDSRQGKSQIWGMKVDGGAPVPISRGGGNKVTLDFSPTQPLIAAADDRNGNLDLYLFQLGAQGKEMRLTRSQENEMDPDWSPDGTGIAFAREQGASFPRIMVVRRDGKDEFEVGPGLDPAWAPDGSALVAATPNGLTLFEGNGKSRVITTGRHDTEPSWSPDGRWLAFRRGRYGVDAEIYLVRVDGTGLRKLTSGSGADAFPAWSPR